MYQDTSSNFLLTLGDYKNVSLQTTKSQPKCFDGIAYPGNCVRQQEPLLYEQATFNSNENFRQPSLIVLFWVCMIKSWLCLHFPWFSTCVHLKRPEIPSRTTSLFRPTNVTNPQI